MAPEALSLNTRPASCWSTTKRRLVMAEQKLIPDEFIPNVGTKTVTINGEDYLVANYAMYTF